MASTITQYSNLINVNFPVPGEDNDSQGFRSNFANIQSALTLAGKEITEIQRSAVNLSTTNDFGNNVIKRAAFQNSSDVVLDVGNVTGFVTVDYALGSYQRFTVDPGDFTFTVVNWPENGKCGTIRLEITPSSSDNTSVNFGGNATVLSKATLPVTYNQQTAIVWELWSPDNGTTIYAHELGLPNVELTGTSIVAYEDLGIGNNRYTVEPGTSATVVSTGNFCQDIALVPCIHTATIVEYGCSNEISAATTTTNFVVDDAKGIKPGSIFFFNSLVDEFTVEQVIGNTIYTQQFDRASLVSDSTGTTLTFVGLRYNQPTVLNLVSQQPPNRFGSKYDLKGQAYIDNEKFWVAYDDYQNGQMNWLPMATLPGANTFTNVNTFLNPIVLVNYTVAELATAPAQNGSMVFVTDTWNSPAYHYNGTWYTMTGTNIIP